MKDELRFLRAPGVPRMSTEDGRDLAADFFADEPPREDIVHIGKEKLALCPDNRHEDVSCL